MEWVKGNNITFYSTVGCKEKICMKSDISVFFIIKILINHEKRYFPCQISKNSNLKNHNLDLLSYLLMMSIDTHT